MQFPSITPEQVPTDHYWFALQVEQFEHWVFEDPEQPTDFYSPKEQVEQAVQFPSIVPAQVPADHYWFALQSLYLMKIIHLMSYI